MKSEVIMIDNHGNGFSEAVEQTRHFCESCDGMSDKEILQLQLISEEMLSLARSITGEMRNRVPYDDADGHGQGKARSADHVRHIHEK